MDEDGRRRAGAQTRRRILDAAAEAIARHGEPGLSVRAVSEAAGANVAAVSYHFRSREALVRAVVDDAFGRITAAQVAALDGVDRPDVAVRDLVAAWAAPILAAVASPDAADFRTVRIVGQILAHPGGDLQARALALHGPANDRLLRALRAVLPEVPVAELRLRVTLCVSALAGLSTGALDGLLAGAEPGRRFADRVVDLLAAVVAAPPPVPASAAADVRPTKESS